VSLVAIVMAAVGCSEPEPGETADVLRTATAAPLYAWLQHGAAGLEARAIVNAGTPCPQVDVDGVASGMTERADAGAEFAVVSCTAPVSGSAGSISVGAQNLPAPSAAPQRILVLGDSGCRMTAGWYENCDGSGTGVPWSFIAAATAAAAERPDLIVHVGDYVYREAECDTTEQPGCAGSPWGDKWTTWEADFFAPSRPLLDVAPWIVTRGNHEDYGRNHLGWLRFLDGRALVPADLTDAGCPRFSAPYKVAFDEVDFLVLNTATDPNASGLDPSAQTRYTEDFSQAAGLVTAGRTAWTVTHRPFWGLAPDWQDPSSLGVADTTLQAAIAGMPGGAWPPDVEMALAGHIHLLETLSFRDGRPHQVVSGDAGTAQDAAITAEAIARNPQVFTQLGIAPDDFQSYHDFGYVLLEPATEGGWTVTVKDLAGDVLEQFQLR
jgi:hypothetical protein